MLPEDIDNLFRQQLDGHATPPTADLWARLALPTTEANPTDVAFRDGLRGHATPPRRELWERLEDEHLRPQPRQRRAVAWWQYSAAAVLVLLLAGGGLLWRTSYPPTAGSEVARQGGSPARTAAPQPSTNNQKPEAAPLKDLVANTTLSAVTDKKNRENSSGQATTSATSPSSTPIATATRPHRAALASQAATNHSYFQRQRPDAARGTLASHGEQRLDTHSESVTPAISPATANNLPLLATTAPTTTPEIIEVEVRQGPIAHSTVPAVVAVAETTPTSARRRGLRLGNLLRQADHLVHGEPVSLAEATGLPETMTVQARLGGRLLSKTIQL